MKADNPDQPDGRLPDGEALVGEKFDTGDLDAGVPDEALNDRLPDSAALLFAPLDKRAFGTAIGAASALLLGATTAAMLLRPGPSAGLGLLANYFTGYSVSGTGALIGAAWAFAVGFVAGWLIAFTRNLTLAVSLFLIRSRMELDEASDFLDHI